MGFPTWFYIPPQTTCQPWLARFLLLPKRLDGYASWCYSVCVTLREYRRREKLSLRGAARKLGMTQAGVAYLEAGHCCLLTTAVRIVSLTDGAVTLLDLLPAEQRPHRGVQPKREECSDDVLLLASLSTERGVRA